MKLSPESVRQAACELGFQLVPPVFRGQMAPVVRVIPAVRLAPRLRIAPTGDRVSRRPRTVALSRLTASGIIFVDDCIWEDGEEFLLPLPIGPAAPPCPLA